MFIDEFAEIVLSYIPFYYFAKVCFLIWLYNPATEGAKYIYEHIIRPLLKKYESHIDHAVKAMKEVVSDIASGASP